MKEAGISSPVDWRAMEVMLEGYHDKDYVIDGFQHGFRIGVNDNNVKLRSLVQRTASSIDMTLVTKLNSELAAGRVLGPYRAQPIPGMQVSPLYTIPKKEEGKYRMIHDLSQPKTGSVNDNIAPEMSTVQYCSVADVVRHIQDSGDRDYFMAKVDMKDAYRSVPIHKQDWRFLGMKIADKYFVDRCLPMGLRSSCTIYQRISDALAWSFMGGSPSTFIANYLDDFLLITTSRQACQTLLDEVMVKCEFMGVPVNAEKTVTATKSLTFLGIGIDVKSRVLFIPEDRRLELIQDIQAFCAVKTQKVNKFQIMIGKLNFICQIVMPGRCFLRSSIDQLKGILSSNKYAQRRVTKDIVMDLRVWQSFLREAVVKPFDFIVCDRPPDYDMVSDASGSIGFGCYMDNEWFSGEWQDPWWKEQNISLLELYPIFVALHLWKAKLENKIILVRTDNEALVAVLTNLYSRHSRINKLLKIIALLTMSNNTLLRLEHIRGVDNTWADKLSRGVFCEEIQNSPSMTRATIPVRYNTANTKQLLW